MAYAYKKRTFLNKNPTMSGFILATLEKFSHAKDDGWRVSSYPSLDIGDCSGKIALDFSFYGIEEMREALKKAHLLKSVIDGFVEAFEKEAAAAEQKAIEIKAQKANPKKK